MDFKQFRRKLTDKAVTYSSGDLGNKLKSVVDKNGVGVFKDTITFSSALDEAKIGGALKQQLLLIASCSNIGDFVINSKSDLDLVDIDNAIHNAVTTTGLAHRVTVRLVTDIFFACGMDFAVEYGFVLGGKGIGQKIHALMPNDLVDIEVNRIKHLFDTYTADTDETQIKKSSIASEAVAGINKLCAAGVPKGFLLLGKCYLNGDLGTVKDSSKAKEYLTIASDMGVSEASTLLGDAYYSSNDYTFAHYFYTRPGALALGKKQRHAINDIYMQGSANLSTLIMSGIVFILSIVFTIYFHSAIFSGAGRVVMAVITNILLGSILGLAIAAHIRKRYDNIRGIIAIQYIVWAFYAFLLLV